MHSIIFSGEDACNATPEYEWSDDEDDSSVDNLVKLIEQRYPFYHSAFTGGASRLDVIRLREEAKAEGLQRKNTKSKPGSSTQMPAGFDIELVADVVKEKVKEDFTRLNTQISTIGESSLAFQTLVLSNLSQMLAKLYGVTENISSFSVAPPRLHTTCCYGPPQRDEHPHSTQNAGTKTDVEFSSVIAEAIRFANRVSSSSAHVSVVLHI